MIITLEYYKDSAITTTSSGFRSSIHHILSVSRSAIGGTYSPIIFVFVYSMFHWVVILNETNLRSKPEISTYESTGYLCTTEWILWTLNFTQKFLSSQEYFALSLCIINKTKSASFPPVLNFPRFFEFKS